jgi:hypothetical protein
MLTWRVTGTGASASLCRDSPKLASASAEALFFCLTPIVRGLSKRALTRSAIAYETKMGRGAQKWFLQFVVGPV